MVPTALPSQEPRVDSLPRAVLAPLTVTVTRGETALDRVPFAVSVVGRDELRRGRATVTLDEALVTVPGVVVANRFNFALDERVAIRGFGARSAFGVRGVKILVDGIPQTLPDGQGQLTNIELGEVERIEVLRGPASSLYGNASGGVINIRTSEDRPAGFAPSGRITAGAFGFTKWQLGADAPVGRGAARLTVSGMQTDGFRDHSEADRRRLGARFTHPLGGGTRVSATLRLADDPTALNPGALTRAEFDSLTTLADPRNVAAGAGKAVTQGQGGVTLQHVVAGGGAIDVTGYALRREIDNPLAFATVELDRWAYGARGSITWPVRLAGEHRVTGGVDAQWQRDDRRNLSPGSGALTLDQIDRVTEIGPFAQLQLSVGPRVTVTLGARYDRLRFALDDAFLDDGDQSGERTLDAWSGSAGLAVDVSQGFQPYASLASAFETPTTTEFVNRPDGGAGLNPELDPQRTWQLEVGVRGGVGQRLEYSIAAFHATVNDELIPFESPTQPGRTVFRNAGSARHRGLEAALTAHTGTGVTLVAAYTLANYRFDEFRTDTDVFDGNRLPGVPQHQLHASIRYRHRGGPWIALDNTYNSAVFADDANTATADAWWVTGVRAGVDWRAAGWRFAPFLTLHNVFDERYAGSVVVNARGGRYFEPAAGRSAIVGMEVRR